MIIDLTTIVARREGVMTAPIDDEIVILNPECDDYIGLDRVGRAVWDLLVTPHGVIDLCQRLSEEFDAAPDEMIDDVLQFLSEMADEGVVRVMGR